MKKGKKCEQGNRGPVERSVSRCSWLKFTGAAGAGIGLAGGMLAASPASGNVLDNLQLMRAMARERELNPEGTLSVLLLGTGSPIPSLDRANTSTMIIAGNKAVIVDFGAGVMFRLAQFGVRNVPLLLFTHFHSDHVADFGQLLMSRTAFGGADQPLKVIGPEGARDVVEGFAQAFARDKKYRIEHHGADIISESGYAAVVAESNPGVVHDEDGLVITMFEVDHKPVAPAVGYKFEYGGKSVVVSGDTIKVTRMVEMARGCDVLVHEAMNRQMVEMAANRTGDPRGQKMALDILTYHTMTDEVAEIAAEANVRKLVLTHLVPAPMNHTMELAFIKGMRKKYKGPIRVGRDGMEIKA